MKRTRSFYGDSEYKKRFPKRVRRAYEARGFKQHDIVKNQVVTSNRAIRAALRSDPFPTAQIVKMRYCETIEIDPGTASATAYYFRANSIFDPNQSGTGHQPYGHDTFATMYNHYQVVKARLHCVFLPFNNDISGSAQCGVSVEDGSSTLTTFDTVRESKGCKSGVLAYGQGKLALSVGYNSAVHFPAGTPQATTADFGANPSEVAYFKIFAQAVSPAFQDPGRIPIIVTIDYTVKVWELKYLTQS